MSEQATLPQEVFLVGPHIPPTPTLAISAQLDIKRARHE